MKTATLPAVRVTQETRALAESVLREGETLSTFIEASLIKTAQWRKDDAEFYARGLASAANARLTGITYSADEVMAELRAKLAAKKKSDAVKLYKQTEAA